jgi:hypothetical protein
VPGLRFIFTVSARMLDVIDHSNAPRPLNIHSNSRKVKGSGFTPQIPEYL